MNMKKLSIFVTILFACGSAFPLFANLPTEDDTKCKCINDEIKEVPINECVDLKIKFGAAANEQDVDLKGFFQLYALKPSPTYYSPQGLQYHNLILNNLERIYYNAKRLIRHDEYMGDGVYKTYYTTEQGERYDSDVVSTELDANITRHVMIFTENREPLNFKFAEGESKASVISRAKVKYVMLMRDEKGELVTDNPMFYDMHLGNGNYIRYSAIDKKVISYNTASGRVITASSPSVGLEAIYDESNTIRQVYSAVDGLADIVIVNPGTKFEIRLYSHDQSGIKNDQGIYVPTGVPYTIWSFENPTPGQNSRLKVSKNTNGTITDYNYTFNYAVNDWMLTYPNGLGIVSKSTSWDYSNTVKNIITTEKSPDGKVAYKEVSIVQKFSFGDRLVSSIVDPDGLNLRTSYTYNDDGKIASLSEASGFWESYQYDQWGRLITLVRPWKNSEFKAPETASQTIHYAYSPWVPNDIVSEYDRRARKIEEKVLGITTKKSLFAYYFDENGSYHEIEELCSNSDGIWGDANNLRTERKFYPKSADASSCGRLEKITYPQGLVETYQYENGNWQQTTDPQDSTFSPGNGAALKITKISNRTSTTEIPNKTIKETTVYDQYGNEVQNEQYIYTGNRYDRIAWIVKQYNSKNQITNIYYSDNTTEKFTWNCCTKDSYTNRIGIQYTYVYDELNRQITETKLGVDGQNNIVTSSIYDVAGNFLSKTTTGGELSLTETFSYNAARKITSKTDSRGITESFSYINGSNVGSNRKGETVHSTLPGERSTIKETYCDGRIATITGNTRPPEYYDYGVDVNGYLWEMKRIGGADSPRFEKITRDLLGRIVKNEKSSFGGTIWEEMVFNSKNQLIAKQSNIQPTILYEYNELGECIRSGFDANNNGILDIESMDLIFEKTKSYVQEENGWWLKTENFIYNKDNNDNRISSKLTKTRLTGYIFPTIFEKISIDNSGKETIESVTLDIASKSFVSLQKNSTSIYPKKTYFVNDLKQYETSEDNLTTLYEYDSLGRISGVTVPRIGKYIISYYSSGSGKIGQISYIQEPSGHGNSLDYDSMGLLVKETNTVGKNRYRSFNKYNLVDKIWGETEQPLQYDYNIFGEKTQMKTYRSFNGDTNWPQDDSADITSWQYDQASGLVTKKTAANGDEISYEYSLDGKVITKVTSKANSSDTLTTNIEYDPITKDIAKITYSDSTPTITFSYNRIGKIKSVTDAVGTRTFTYDDYSRLTSENISGLYSKIITREYSPSSQGGKINKLIVDNITLSSYNYDDTGTLSQVISQEKTISFETLEDSMLLGKIKRSNELETNFIYEPTRDSISQIQNGSISNYQYTTDIAGRIISATSTGNAYSQAINETYTYNDRSELVGITSTLTGETLFSYDSISNLKSYSDNKDEKIYSANNANQYSNIITNNVVQNYTYNNAGSLISDGIWTYVWDCNNRLISLSSLNIKIDFLYDYMGRRVSKKQFEKINDTWQIKKHEYFIYDEDKLIQILDALNNNNIICSFIWTPDTASSKLPLMMHHQGQHYYYVLDRYRNVCQIVDEQENIVAKYHYSPYGSIISKSGDIAEINPILWNCSYYDFETNLVYSLNRYYSPELKRWISKDPLNEEGGINLYAFVLNSPTNFIDPLGLEKCTPLPSWSIGAPSKPGLVLGPVKVVISAQFEANVEECSKCCDEENLATYKKINGTGSVYISAYAGAGQWGIDLGFIKIEALLGIRIVGSIVGQGGFSLVPADPCKDNSASADFCITAKGSLAVEGGVTGFAKVFGRSGRLSGLVGGEVYASAQLCSTCTMSGCGSFEFRNIEVGAGIYLDISAELELKNGSSYSWGGKFTLIEGKW